jgi:putative flippase GtrA
LNSASFARLLRFAVVGVAGAAIHMAVFEGVRRLSGLGPALSWIASFGVAATATWAMNRRFTFRARREDLSVGEWGRYLAVAGSGALAHFLVFGACVASGGIFAAAPALAIIPGSLASLCVTYAGSSLFVFASARNRP